jgi:hypothetical protein
MARQGEFPTRQAGGICYQEAHLPAASGGANEGGRNEPNSNRSGDGHQRNGYHCRRGGDLSELETRSDRPSVQQRHYQ